MRTRVYVAAIAMMVSALIAVPFAASAEEPDYPQTTETSVPTSGPADFTAFVENATASAGEPASLVYHFDPSRVPGGTTVSVSGDQGVTLSVLRAAPVYSATQSGVVTVTAAASRAGTYSITASSGGTALTATLTVTGGAAAAADSANGLSSTGYNAPVLLLWIAAGVIALGIALLITLRVVRRSREQA